MFGPFIFGPLLLAVCIYALWRGGPDERVVALTCLAGTAATMLVISPLRQRYTGVEEGLLLVDLAVLAGFITVALRSKRFWPDTLVNGMRTDSEADGDLLAAVVSVDQQQAFDLSLAEASNGRSGVVIPVPLFNAI